VQRILAVVDGPFVYRLDERRLALEETVRNGCVCIAVEQVAHVQERLADCTTCIDRGWVRQQ
jgi:hypothetical protein